MKLSNMIFRNQNLANTIIFLVNFIKTIHSKVQINEINSM